MSSAERRQRVAYVLGLVAVGLSAGLRAVARELKKESRDA